MLPQEAQSALLDLSHPLAGQANLATDRQEGPPVRALLENLALPGLEIRHGEPECIKLGVLVEVVIGLMPIDDLTIQSEFGVAIPVHHGSRQA